MIGFWLSVCSFNLLAWKYHHRLTRDQLIAVWLFTICFQLLFDLVMVQKYEAYWLFSKAINWTSFVYTLLLLPPVNIVFLHFFTGLKGWRKQTLYLLCFALFMALYEALALLPEPFGYFYYGWWKYYYSFLIDPFLALTILLFYKGYVFFTTSNG